MKSENVRKLPQWTNAKIVTYIVQDFRAKIFPTITRRAQVQHHIEAKPTNFVWKELNLLNQSGSFCKMYQHSLIIIVVNCSTP